jgi:ribonuclease BN (tRNA processing enzyme)
MFDCGEGAGIRLDDHVFVPEVLAISHIHLDHCRGLVGFLGVRWGIKGVNNKELGVVYPAGSGRIEYGRSDVDRWFGAEQQRRLAKRVGTPLIGYL